jgi:hypothetical protein
VTEVVEPVTVTEAPVETGNEAVEEEIVPIDLAPVEIDEVVIDQRDDHDIVVVESEPFTISTTSTGVIPTSTHALVLPTLPEEDPNVIAALSQTGEIVITGQITLPVLVPTADGSVATSGVNTSDLDVGADSDDDEDLTAGQELAPVSAAQAVSAFSGAAVTVTMPKRSSERLPMVLAIAAAVLAVGVVGLFIANYFLRVF